MNKIVTLLLNRLMLWLCGESLWGLAQAWVKLYENKDLPSDEKRERVLVMLETELKTLGRTLTTSILNLVIEAAVQYVRRTHR